MALVGFCQSLTLYCFALFSEVLIPCAAKPGKTRERWVFLLVGFFVLVPFIFSGRLSDKEPSFVVCASVLLIPLICNIVITSPRLLVLPSPCSEGKNTPLLQPVFVVRTGAGWCNGETQLGGLSFHRDSKEI